MNMENYMVEKIRADIMRYASELDLDIGFKHAIPRKTMMHVIKTSYDSGVRHFIGKNEIDVVLPEGLYLAITTISPPCLLHSMKTSDGDTISTLINQGMFMVHTKNRIPTSGEFRLLNGVGI